MALSVQGLGAFDDLAARSTLARWVEAALEGHTGQINLRFVDTREGRRLNRDFRHKDYATNVLTFDYQHAPVVVADIVICVPVVRREARAQGKTLRHHLAHLVVHGVLHARGMDHARASETRAMEARELAILQRFGHPDPYLSV